MGKTLLAAMLAATMAVPAQAGPVDDINRIVADHWSWWLAQNPVVASSLGVRDFDRQIADLSLASQDRQAKDAGEFIKRLDAVPDSGLDPATLANKMILRRMLAEQIEANGFGQRTMMFSTYDSPFQGYAGMADGLPFATKADYDSYIDRLTKLGGLAPSMIAITRQALKGGFIQPCDAMGGFDKTITGAVAGKPEDTRFYSPFRAQRPTFISAADWATLQGKAVAAIHDVVTPQYQSFAQFYVKEYQPKCRKSVGASAMPNGLAWYESRIRAHTTTTLSADEIHRIGLAEVARIRSRMDKVAASAGYASREAMVADLRTNPKYYAKSADELVAAASKVAKQIDGMMPRYFATLPRLPYGIKTIPAETAETTTTAYYSPGAPPSGIAGNYYVNTSKLNQRPLFELPALTAHEAVPGHHHQIALQQELNLPEFRKYAVGFTAFVEGWALYTEYLGEEMGLYATPPELMGRLSYEMWRACRLVVDTGMHAKGWSKAQAVQFMKDNTALSDANIDAEVNRYISWPGQALGYKLGEIRIRELRARTEQRLGTKFNLRRFHDAVLSQGPVPLDTLDRQIDNWIAEELKRTD